MTNSDTFLACLAALMIFAVAGIALAGHISAWEAANGYPYGKMCNSIFTFNTDTCRR